MAGGHFYVEGPGGVNVIKQAQGYLSRYPIWAPVVDSGGQVFNVMSRAFGAVGDGSTDDTAAIQAAADAAYTAGGGTVFFPAKRFRTTSAIVPRNNVRFQGSGWGTVIAPSGTPSSGNPLSAFQLLAPLNSPLLNAEFCDFMIDGSDVNHPASYNPGQGKGIYIQHATRLRLRNVYCYGTNATGFGVDFLVDSIIEGCVADTCGTSFAVGGTVGSNGIGIGTGAYATESWVVSDSIAKNCGNVGIMCEAQNGTVNSMYMTMANCLSYGNGTGYLDSGVSRVSFENCWAWANTSRSGFLINCGDLLIPNGVYMPQEVYLRHCYAFGQTSSSGFTIDDDQLATDIQLGGNIHLEGCVSAYNSVRGFYIHNTAKVSLTNCESHDNAEHGVLAFSDSPTTPMNNLHIVGGQFYNNGTSFSNTFDGIRVGSSGSGLFNDCMIANVKSYDDNRVTLTDAAITTGLKVLTSAKAGFSPSDVGKSITVNGAGSAGGTLNTTIASWQSLNQVTLTAAASTTVTGATATYGSILQRYGISVAGTTNNTNIRILNNDVRGNSTAAINSGTVTGLEIRGNAGYNPLGPAAITVTASPFTYTAGPTPEDVFINGGTVSAIAKNSTTLAAVSPAAVHLEPGQAVVVTYSVAPTMVADKY